MKKRIDDALEKFIEKYKKNPNVVGIILSGSYVYGDFNENSDLDVNIVLKNSGRRTRGNTWINGIEIEYYLNPIKQIEYYFKTELSRTTAHMFSYCKILFQRGKYIDSLIKKAKNALGKPMEKMDTLSKELNKYFFNYIEKQLMVAYSAKDDFVFNQIAIKVLNASLSTFLKINGIYREKPSRLFDFLKKKNKRFVVLYKNALLEKNIKRRYGYLIKLIRFIENKLGGRRPKEWEVTSKCNYEEKEIYF